MSTWRTTRRTRIAGLLAIATVSALAAFAAPPASESPQWSAKLARIVARDEASPPPAGAIVFAGSSSIERWPALAGMFPGARVLNRGVGGSWLSDFADDAEAMVLTCQPGVVVLYAGENDLAAGFTPADVRDAFIDFRARLRTTAPRLRLIFLAIKPSPLRSRLLKHIREANTLISAECGRDPWCTFIDVFTPMLDAAGTPRPELFSTDGLHLSPAGYRLWNQLLVPALAGERNERSNTRPAPAASATPAARQAAVRES